MIPSTWSVSGCRRTGNRVSKGRNNNDPGTLSAMIRSKVKKSPSINTLMERRLLLLRHGIRGAALRTSEFAACRRVKPSEFFNLDRSSERLARIVLVGKAQL
jgi:hypothetical protein